MAEEAIYAIMESDATLLDYLQNRVHTGNGQFFVLEGDDVARYGFRVYPGFIPVIDVGIDDFFWPAAVYYRVDSEFPMTLTEPSELVSARFKIDIWDAVNTAPYSYLKEVADRVRLVFDGQTWTGGGYVVASCEMVDDEDIYKKVKPGASRAENVISTEFLIWYYEQ